MRPLTLALTVWLALAAWSTRTASAYDCYQVKTGTKLYAEVMAETVVGEATADVVGWFGRSDDPAPALWLRFVALDGGGLVSELDAYVKKEDARAVACPASWERVDIEPVELTWPDARRAGSAVRTSLAARRKKAKKKHGRACFAADIPGVSATVCAATDDRARATCVSIRAGMVVFARASTAAKLGVTTAPVVAAVRARVDDLLAVRALGADRSIGLYVRRADTKPARCPEPDNHGRLGVIPPSEALLPDGTDAGFRVARSPWTRETVVVIGTRTLRCFDDTPVTGLALRICVQD